MALQLFIISRQHLLTEYWLALVPPSVWEIVMSPVSSLIPKKLGELSSPIILNLTWLNGVPYNMKYNE